MVQQRKQRWSESNIPNAGQWGTGQGRNTTDTPWSDCQTNGKARRDYTAVLQIRYERFKIKRPSILNKIKHLKDTREAAVIYVREEEQQDKAAEPVEWFLMTNEKVESVEDAAD